MTIIARTAGLALALAAPALVAVGVATAHADASVANTGPTATSHPVFPSQHNAPVPGSSTHHHHQNNHAK